MIKSLFVLGSLFLGVFSCHKQEDSVFDSTGVVIKLPQLWKTSLSNNGALVEVVSEAQVTDSRGNFLVGANRDNNRYLVSLNSVTGHIEWEWSDLLPASANATIKDPLSINEGDYYQKDDRVTFLHGGNTYCLNLQNGTTFWKHQQNLLRSPQVGGIGNFYFNAGYPPTSNQGDILYMGNVLTNNLEKELIKPQYDLTGKQDNSGQNGWIKRIIPLTLNQDTLLCVLYMDPALEGYQYRSAMGLYNLTRNVWVYNRSNLNQASANTNITHARLYQNKVYHASGRSLHCHDLMTGREIWVKSFPQGFGSSGFIIVNDKLFANCEDTYTYCLDAQTGQQVWQEKSAGTSSPISYLNNVIYFLGGGDGRLHAIDATTGKHLWKVVSPDETVNSGAWFYGTCTILPGKEGEKGRVMATTGLSAYCYEAIR
ncbi:outer membrane protein assembly factor BamB family protein [Spirosoma foliorum]|uniref:PQQ-binding-like beta-propeller repeat protein n=1 Tax=Spirosoma foliorum TaxID=2710596 RepID=A0A7G5GRI2_9BACT|nr:PQQ-binding-like beta-propeller repeat protein [Spirosoma foliorum]QMW01474.1 PQQ-binding-like beta-propeller repeat protein [Spirosoma foliorum]